MRVTVSIEIKNYSSLEISLLDPRKKNPKKKLRLNSSDAVNFEVNTRHQWHLLEIYIEAPDNNEGEFTIKYSDNVTVPANRTSKRKLEGDVSTIVEFFSLKKKRKSKKKVAKKKKAK